jgi:hypothetical protein
VGFQKKQMEAKEQRTAGAMAITAAPNSKQSPDSNALIPASEVLQALLDNLPPDNFTLGWLSSHLHRRSFGVIVLVLALVAMVPGISYVAGFLLLAPAFEMVAGRSAPTFPRRIAGRSLPTRHLAVVVRRAVPILINLERIIRPRWKIPSGTTKRLVGFAVLLLTILLLLTPLPMIQVVPSLIIILLSVAYLEDDGLLLSLALLAALVVVGASAAAVWGMIAGAKWWIGL